jgi:heptosyltransferase-3
LVPAARLFCLELIKQISELKIDTVVYLAGVRTLKTLLKTKLTVFRDWLFFKAAGVKNTIGFPSVLPDFELSVDEATGHLEWEAKRLARRVKHLAILRLMMILTGILSFTAEEINAAGQQFAPLAAGQPLIAASTGTKSQVNDWEEHNWLKLLKQLSPLCPGWQLVMVGGPDEVWQGRQVY